MLRVQHLKSNPFDTVKDLLSIISHIKGHKRQNVPERKTLIYVSSKIHFQPCIALCTVTPTLYCISFKWGEERQSGDNTILQH